MCNKKINNILYRNKTKIGFRTLIAVAILSVITLSAIICTNATRIQVINKPLLSTLMAETGYTLKNKDNSRSILYTKDNNYTVTKEIIEKCFECEKNNSGNILKMNENRKSVTNRF